METFRKTIMKYRHGVPLAVYSFIYLAWFKHLEETITSRYQVIHVSLDDVIPFCEVFVFLSTGMTVFLLISTLFPNGHHLRPHIMPRDNIFTQMVAALYKTDTPTNLWPSIHVYNSPGCHIAIMKSDRIKI